MQLRGFVMLHSAAAGWTVSVCRDLDAVLDAWRARQQDAVGVLHLGFDRPPSAAFEEAASPYTGRMLLTASARFGLPAGYDVHPDAVGEAAGLPLYLAVSGFGYQIEASELPQATIPENAATLPVFCGWIAMFVGQFPQHADELALAGIKDEDSYQAEEEGLDRSLRLALGRYRFDHLIGADDSDPARIAQYAPPWLQALPLSVLPLSVRIDNVMRRQNIKTVGEIAQFAPDRLLHTQNFGRTSYHLLRRILLEALSQGPNSDEDGYVAAEAVTLREGMSATLARLNDRERDILVRRMGLYGRAETLMQIGESHGVTRERIRQIEAKVVRRIIDDDRWDNLLARKLETLLRGREHPLPVIGVEAIDPWFTGIANNGDALAYILENMCGDRFHVIVVDDVPYFAVFDQERWERCQREARALLSANVAQGWDEGECRSVIASVLDVGSREFSGLLWDSVRAQCHFTASSDRPILTGFGGNIEALVEAILREANAPLHFSQIATLVAQRGGREVDERRVHNAAQEVGFLFGRGLYGSDRHCPLHPETRAACLQEVERIIADGPVGRQWHCAELCQLLAAEGIEVGDLDKYALEIVLRRSDTLVRLGRFTWTAKVGDRPVARTGIREAIVTILRDAGGPLRSSEIAERLNVVRGTDDVLPIWSFDPVVKLSRGLWGLNDRDVPIDRKTQAMLFDGLARRLAAAQVGIPVADLVAEVPGLTGLGVDADLLCALATHHRQVSMTGERVFYLAEWGHPRRQTLREVIIEVLGASRAGLTFDRIVSGVEQRTGQSCDRARVSTHLQKHGNFDPMSECWTLPAQSAFNDPDQHDAWSGDGSSRTSAQAG